MATITGTSGNDHLIGTDQDDLLQAYGGVDLLEGGLGADTYQLWQGGGLHVVTIRDTSRDGAVDSITGGRGIHASASLGYTAWASAERVGDDLTIVLPGKPSRFRKPGYGPLTITIEDHYGDGEVEYLTAGDTTYRLTTLTDLGASTENLLMAGSAAADEFITGSGTDFVTGNGGSDRIVTGAGDDVAFGGKRGDVIRSGAGDDRVHGDAGRDRVFAGDGNDYVMMGSGNDKAVGGAGVDYLFGEEGKDVLKGQAGKDTLIGGVGNDRLIGGKDGDVYRFGYDHDNYTGTGQWGHDVVRDVGDRVTGYNNHDTIELMGLYGPSDGSRAEAFAQLEVARQGDDMWIATTDGLSSITVRDQFITNPRHMIEELEFYAGYWSAMVFRIIDAEHHDIGDDRGTSWGEGGERHELIFGSEGDDQVFGDSGYNFIWLGGGADTLIYKESDPQIMYDLDQDHIGGGAVIDMVMDFNVAEDRLDFTETKGLSFGDLTISADTDGDAIISWNSGDFEVASISIELRGASTADVSESLFLFA